MHWFFFPKGGKGDDDKLFLKWINNDFIRRTVNYIIWIFSSKFGHINKTAITGDKIRPFNTMWEIEMRSEIQFGSENLLTKTTLEIFRLLVYSNGMSSSTD